MKYCCLFAVAILFGVPGCGSEESTVPEALRAPPQTAATPATAIPNAPRGAAAPESAE